MAINDQSQFRTPNFFKIGISIELPSTSFTLCLAMRPLSSSENGFWGHHCNCYRRDKKVRIPCPKCPPAFIFQLVGQNGSSPQRIGKAREAHGKWIWKVKITFNIWFIGFATAVFAWHKGSSWSWQRDPGHSQSTCIYCRTAKEGGRWQAKGDIFISISLWQGPGQGTINAFVSQYSQIWVCYRNSPPHYLPTRRFSLLNRQ